MPSRSRLILALICLGVASALAAGLYLTLGGAPGLSRTGAATGAAAIGGPFRLVDQNGRPADQRILNGKWSAVFFGYTFCPEFCPTNLQTLARAQDSLGDKAKNFQVVFVSIDPQRDTPQALKAFLSNSGFPHGAVGLTGTPAEVAEAAKAYRVFYARSGVGKDYLMDHSTVTYLMGPKGEFEAVIQGGATPAQVARQIEKAMAG